MSNSINLIGIPKFQHPWRSLLTSKNSGTWGNRGKGNELQSALEKGLSWIGDKFINSEDYLEDGFNYLLTAPLAVVTGKTKEIPRVINLMREGRHNTSLHYAMNPVFDLISPIKGGWMLKGLMKGSLLEKQLSKAGTVSINGLQAYLNKASKLELGVIRKVLSTLFAGLKNIDYNALRKAVSDELITYYRKPLNKYSTYGMDKIGFDLKKESDGAGGLVEYVPGVKTLTFTFESPRIPRGNSAHYDFSTLGHSRTYTTPDEPDILHVMESLSDWALATTSNPITREIVKHAKDRLKNLEELLLEVLLGTYKDDIITEDLLLKLINKERNTINNNSGFGKTFSLQELYLRENYPLRQLLENIKYAAENRYTKMRYPTSETAAKIEGYSKAKTVGEDYLKAFDLNKKINTQLYILNNYRIERPKIYTAGNAYKVNGSTGRTDIKIDANGNISRVAVGDGVDYHLIENDFELGNKVRTLPKVFPDLEEVLYEQSMSNYMDKIEQLKNLIKHIEYNGPELYTPEHQTILKKYADFPKMFNKLFKGLEIRTVTDPKGNTWYEVDIPENFLESEWLFKKGGILGLNKIIGL